MQYELPLARVLDRIARFDNRIARGTDPRYDPLLPGPCAGGALTPIGILPGALVGTAVGAGVGAATAPRY